MSLCVLVSTMNQLNYNLINQMKINSTAVVVNQCLDDSEVNLIFNNSSILWVNSNDIGLSKSRNIAIKKSSSEICLLADDDLEYVGGYSELIIEQFKLNPDADIIAFQVNGIEEKFKDYYSKPRKLNFITSMKVSSVEIAFRRKSVIDKRVLFNEKFGSGSKYSSGEENIFLADCLRKKLKIIYVPIKIADLHIGQSSWFNGFNTAYFFSKGAGFAAISRVFSIALILQFAIRKRNLYSGQSTIAHAIKTMLIGRQDFLKNY